jgi:hypothetical protein
LFSLNHLYSKVFVAGEMRLRLEGAKKFSGPLFVVEGAIWVGVILLGSGFLLLWPALASFASGAALIRFTSSHYTGVLVKASSLYGIVVALYQIYVASALLSSSFVTFASISIALFSAVVVLYVVLLFISGRS